MILKLLKCFMCLISVHAFSSGFSYVRHLKTVRTHLLWLVNHSNTNSEENGVDYAQGLTEQTWRSMCSNGKVKSFSLELSRLWYEWKSGERSRLLTPATSSLAASPVMPQRFRQMLPGSLVVCMKRDSL